MGGPRCTTVGRARRTFQRSSHFFFFIFTSDSLFSRSAGSVRASVTHFLFRGLLAARVRITSGERALAPFPAFPHPHPVRTAKDSNRRDPLTRRFFLFQFR